MKQPQNSRKSRARSSSRNKGGAKNGGNSPGNRVDVRVRGNPKQHLEKYKNLAREAMQAGDRVQAEYYFQFADHYQRVLNELRGPDRFYDDDADQDGDDVSSDDDDDGDSEGEGEGQGQQQSDNDDRRDRGRRGRGRGRGRGGRQQDDANGDNGSDDDTAGNRGNDEGAGNEGELPLAPAAPRGRRRAADPSDSDQPVEVHPELEFEGGALREVKPRRPRAPRRPRTSGDTPSEGGEAA
ncbi:DUF4167 domain-containing protein [Gimibacter soli]|uniref:DUF4167 domain-containing protein n=1 Tax=Gimibacter soli TaxID=3024400 RepID=A0AAE9XSD9_9PROT|nr:DUF4167 domain-containing protein [Gimibacter soli]WCL54145.1 DUF4167 domain-containing protein [Gimibacter soli]